MEHPDVRDSFGSGPHYWLVGEVPAMPPLDVLVATRQRMDELGLIVSDRMSCVRVVSPTRNPEHRTTTWRAALRSLRLGDIACDGANEYLAGFRFIQQLLVCRVPSSHPDALTTVWNLAQELYDLWQPSQFYVTFNVLYLEPYVLQHQDLWSAPSRVSGLYGYSWIVGAAEGSEPELGQSLLRAAESTSAIQAVRTRHGVLARMGHDPTAGDPETRERWAALLRPWLKKSDSPTTPPSLTTGANKIAPWVIWHEAEA